MPLHAPVRWTLTYDIADPGRGTRVHRLVRGHGVSLQRSVFLIDATAAEMEHLIEQLQALIDPARDDVRVYRWPARTTVDRLGPPLFIEELLPDYHLDLPLAA